MKVGILGGGISGITLATLLKEKGIPLILFEKESTPGGLMRSRITDGYVFDISGGHVFNSKFPDVKEFLFSRLPQEKQVHRVRNAKILFKGKIVSYPFELALGEIDPEDAAECIISLIRKKGREPRNFRDWLIWRFGRSIADFYLIPYNRKIWRYPLKQMEADWAKQDKIPIPLEKEIIVAALSNDPGERKTPHSTFYYPRTGGSQSFIDAVAANLTQRDICLDTPVESLEKSEKGWIINGSERVDTVISTMPLTELSRIMPSLPARVVKAISGLKYNGVTSLLYETSPNDISWLYVPGREIPYHRLVYMGNFSPCNTPRGKNSCIAEFTGRGTRERLRAVQEHMGTRLIDSNFTEMAYVVYDSGYTGRMRIINEYLDSIGLHRVGRFATWRYLNFDVSMKHAFECVKTLFPGYFQSPVRIKGAQ